MKLYQKLAQKLIQYQNVSKPDSTYLIKPNQVEDEIIALVKNYLPSGSGFDAGTTLDLTSSSPNCLIFRTSFHHMNEHGMYDGWTEHIIRVRPHLAFDIDLTIFGPNRNQIKDYIHDVFHNALVQEYIK